MGRSSSTARGSFALTDARYIVDGDRFFTSTWHTAGGQMPTLMPLSSTMCSQLLFDGYHDSCTLIGVTWPTFTSCGATDEPAPTVTVQAASGEWPFSLTARTLTRCTPVLRSMSSMSALVL